MSLSVKMDSESKMGRYRGIGKIAAIHRRKSLVSKGLRHARRAASALSPLIVRGYVIAAVKMGGLGTLDSENNMGNIGGRIKGICRYYRRFLCYPFVLR